MNKILIVALLLLCPFAFAEAKTPKSEWEYHLITKMPPHAERYDNVFVFKKEKHCRTFLQLIERVLEGSREEYKGFSWVGICSPVQKV